MLKTITAAKNQNNSLIIAGFFSDGTAITKRNRIVLKTVIIVVPWTDGATKKVVHGKDNTMMLMNLSTKPVEVLVKLTGAETALSIFLILFAMLVTLLN